MRAVDIIEKKRDGIKLDDKEIRFLIEEYTAGNIPDYQMAAWLMAVYFQGMDAEETAALTMAMAESGEQADLSEIAGIKVDKHSTGGVGDTTTLVLAPLAAAAGVPVAKMSGRGLGHTGGTIDKLESIPGYQVERTKQQFIAQVNEIGVAVISQTGNIAPADKKLYALRDVTATVNSIPLIASSIMSKKIASGADAIVLDVKTGPGAFMKTMEEAVKLAQAMVDIGKQVGRKTVALISSMDQPLGYAVGNALEMKEAIDALKGNGPEDLEQLCMKLGEQMLIVGGIETSEQAASERLKEVIRSGQALQKWQQWMTAQGGDASAAEDSARLPTAQFVVEVSASEDGYVQAMASEQIGKAAMMLGAGRMTKDSSIDLAAGIILRKKIGDYVRKGECLAELHWNDETIDPAPIKQMTANAYQLGSAQAAPPPLILAIVTEDGMIPS